MFKFTKLELRNFRKHSQIDMLLDNQGIVRIEGKNGAGKSSVFEGFMWVLFGSVIRGDSATDVIKKGEKTVWGKVDFVTTDPYHQYSIIRQRDTTTQVTLIVDGEIREFNTATDAQHEIERILGVDKTLFRYIIYLDQYSSKSFISETDTSKKELLENILNMDIFIETEKYLKANNKELELIIQKHKNLLERCEQLINLKNKNIAFLEKTKNNIKLEKTEHQIDKYEKEIERLQKLIEKEKEKVSNHSIIIDDLRKTITACQKNLPNIENLYFNERELTKKETLYNQNKCPVCGQPITGETRDGLKKEIDKLKEQKEYVTKIKEEYNSGIKNINELKNKMQEYTQEYTEAKRNIDLYLSKIVSIKKNAKEWVDYVEEQKRQKESIEKQITKEKQLVQQLTTTRDRQKQLYEKALLVGKNIQRLIHAFGKDGIKNNFFAEYVSFMERDLNIILSYLLPSVKVQITTKANKSGKRNFSLHFLRDDIPMRYESFSGGERKRIDIAFILVLQRLSEYIGKFRCNLLIFDELFDSLDMEGVEQVSNYFADYDKESIFIITHSPHISDIYQKVISFD